MDQYSDYCYGYLADFPEGIKFLKNLGFYNKEDILKLKPVSGKEVQNDESLTTCKFCKLPNAIQRSIQTRSLDEGETLYTICKSCGKTY